MNKTQRLVEKFSDFKTLPHVAIRINQLAQNENSTMQDFEEIIQLDPVLVARLLRLVNSPYFGLSEQVESITKAVIFVGLSELRNLVTVEVLKDFFHDESGADSFSRSQLWFHSATVAILAKMIATRVFGKDGTNYFLAGIVHDIGLVVEDQVCTKELRQVCEEYQPEVQSLTDYEDKIIDTNHCHVGAALARELQFSKEVIKAVRFHHHSEINDSLDSVVSVVHLADIIASKLHHSPIENKVDLPAPVFMKHILDQKNHYRLIIKALPGEIETAKELYEVGN